MKAAIFKANEACHRDGSDSSTLRSLFPALYFSINHTQLSCISISIGTFPLWQEAYYIYCWLFAQCSRVGIMIVVYLLAGESSTVVIGFVSATFAARVC